MKRIKGVWTVQGNGMNIVSLTVKRGKTQMQINDIGLKHLYCDVYRICSKHKNSQCQTIKYSHQFFWEEGASL